MSATWLTQMADLFTRTAVSVVNRVVDAEIMADGFDEFYARYPRKVGKGQARKAYAKAMKVTTHDEIMFALSQQLPGMEAKEKQYRPHPATWLNGERWDDEPEQPNSMAGGKHSSANAGAEQISNAAAARRAPAADLF